MPNICVLAFKTFSSELHWDNRSTCEYPCTILPNISYNNTTYVKNQRTGPYTLRSGVQYTDPTIRRSHKKISKRKTHTTSIFWSHPYPGILETHNTASLLFLCCRWFWREIYWQRKCRPYYRRPLKNYEISEDCTGGLYCCITLKCNYDNEI